MKIKTKFVLVVLVFVLLIVPLSTAQPNNLKEALVEHYEGQKINTIEKAVAKAMLTDGVIDTSELLKNIAEENK